MLPWPKVQRRIAQLIKEDRFYTEVEQDRFDNIDPIAIREALAERGIVNGELVDEEKLDNDPFIQRVMADVEAISRESVPADEPEQPSPHNLRVLVSDEEYAAARGTLRERTSYDPAVPPYNVGDIVYLDDRPHQITELRDDTVQLLPTGMSYPIYRAESRERFEQLLREDNRNDFYTEFLPANLDTVDQDLRDVLAHGLIGEADKAELSELLRNGKSNQEVALWLSRAYPNIVETMELETGETADYRTMPEGIELEVLDADEKRLAMLFFQWSEVARFVFREAAFKLPIISIQVKIIDPNVFKVLHSSVMKPKYAIFGFLAYGKFVVKKSSAVSFFIYLLPAKSLSAIKCII